MFPMFHLSVISSGLVPRLGSMVFARVSVDESRLDAGLRAVEAHGLPAWRERRARHRAAIVAGQAAKAARLAAEFSRRAEQSVKELMPLPPGLHAGATTTGLTGSMLEVKPAGLGAGRAP